MRFLITQDAVNVGVSHPVVALYRNVGKGDASVYDERIKGIIARLGELREKVLPSEEVRGFRELYAAVGAKRVTPAGERLLASTEKRGFPRYGNLVDAYNIVALENLTPIGVHDATALMDDRAILLFRRAHGTERMIPSFETSEKVLPKGDLTYGIWKDDSFTPFAWLGKKDCDNSAFQLKPDSSSMLLTAIGNKYTSEARNREICQIAFDLLKLSCQDATMELFTPTVITEGTGEAITAATEALVSAAASASSVIGGS